MATLEALFGFSYPTEVFGIQLFLHNWKIIPENLMLWAILANLLGVFEHVNYYNRQLMVDHSPDIAFIKRNRKLKVASLAKDLNENQF